MEYGYGMCVCFTLFPKLRPIILHCHSADLANCLSILMVLTQLFLTRGVDLVIGLTDRIKTQQPTLFTWTNRSCTQLAHWFSAHKWTFHLSHSNCILYPPVTKHAGKSTIYRVIYIYIYIYIKRIVPKKKLNQLEDFPAISQGNQHISTPKLCLGISE